MVNGAGLAMTTMDLVKRAGGEPANFLDIGGGARADKVAHAMQLILSDPKVDAILVNIFGGITRGDEVARGLIEARAQQTRDVPMVVRIVGTNAAEAAAPARGGALPDGRDRSTRRRPRPSPRPVARRRRREHPRRIARRGSSCRASPAARVSSTRERCQAYGTNVVAGVTPGKGGQVVLDGTVPVFDTVAEAVRETGANTSLIFVPAAGAPDAVMEAAAAGIATIFCITEGIPALDMIPTVEVVRSARRPADRPELSRRHVAGPGQGRASSQARSIARAGSGSSVASGTLTYEAVQAMTDAGLGQSTCLGIGGDPIIGTTFLDVAPAVRRRR